MTPRHFPIAATTARYIKLGTNNAWFSGAKANKRIEFGHSAVPHEMASRGNRAEIAAFYREHDRTKAKASDFAREVVDFYTQDRECLWITFAEGSLWCGFTESGVTMLGESDSNGERARTLAEGWSNLDADGKLLTIGSLSTRLTKVAAYRQTICGVEALDYLIRRINAIDEPAVAAAKRAQQAMLASANDLITGLHWRDFEVMCDLIFARSGWQRVAELGGLQKDTDLDVDQAATGERAFVQIKSAAATETLNDYVTRFEADPGFDRMFFICHSPRGALAAPISSKPVHIWVGQAVARQAIAAGLYEWLIGKSA